LTIGSPIKSGKDLNQKRKNDEGAQEQ